MSIDKNSAAVDNDFINKVAQIKTGTMSPENIVALQKNKKQIENRTEK